MVRQESPKLLTWVRFLLLLPLRAHLRGEMSWMDARASGLVPPKKWDQQLGIVQV